MANTYTKIYIQYVFAVKNRECLLKSNDEKLQKYISGIIANRKSKMLAINNMPDHIHILISQHPSYSVSKMAQEIKNNSLANNGLTKKQNTRLSELFAILENDRYQKMKE